MYARRSVIALAVLIAIGAIAVHPWLLAQERKGDADNPFEGKFLSVRSYKDPEYSTYLEKVQVKKLGDQSFLVGIGADVPDNWQKGLTVWLSIRDVSEITVFPSKEVMHRSIGQEQ